MPAPKPSAMWALDRQQSKNVKYRALVSVWEPFQETKKYGMAQRRCKIVAQVVKIVKNQKGEKGPVYKKVKTLRLDEALNLFRSLRSAIVYAMKEDIKAGFPLPPGLSDIRDFESEKIVIEIDSTIVKKPKEKSTTIRRLTDKQKIEPGWEPILPDLQIRGNIKTQPISFDDDEDFFKKVLD